MDAHTRILNGKTARYFTMSNPKAQQTAHFYGGNGFAVGVYAPLLNALHEKLNISALAMRGEWIDKPTSFKNTREQDAELLIQFLEQTQDKPVIGIGHSQGATATTMAAAKRPELFSQLFLLEPVTFTKRQALLYNLTPKTLKLTQEPFKSTLKKPATWPSVEAYYQHLREHKAYKRISDDHLQTYATNSLAPLEQGSSAHGHDWVLKFPPAQELANYFGMPFIMDALEQVIRADKAPVTLIIGKPSMFISDEVRQTWEKFVPAERIITLSKYGHLLPMEAPELCAELILDALN